MTPSAVESGDEPVAGLTHHNSEYGLAGKPCLPVKSKLLVTFSQLFDSVLANKVYYN